MVRALFGPRLRREMIEGSVEFSEGVASWLGDERPARICQPENCMHNVVRFADIALKPSALSFGANFG
jgi:hypothetical protein